MLNKIQDLAIKFISWNLKRNKVLNLEIVVRHNGNTVRRRDRKRETNVEKTLREIR